MPNISQSSAAASGSLRFSSKLLTFTGGSTLGLHGTASTIFTCTGEVLILSLVPFNPTTSLTGATATLTLGITGSTTLFIGTTTATDIAAGKFWIDATPDANGIALPAAMQNIVITDDVICSSTHVSADVVTGTIRFDCWWLPLSSDGNLA